MQFAAIETSTPWCSVALWRDGELASRERLAGHRHSELVLPMLQALLQASGVSMASLDAVAFGAGPGSFTGLRIACALAQGLALSRDLPVLGLSAFEALAEESGGPRVAACIDARMGEVYFAALQREDGKEAGRWREVVPAQCLAPQEVRVPPGQGWIGCGSGFAAYGELGFELALPAVHPTAAAIAALAAPRFAAGEGVDAALAAPAYLREKVALTREEQEAR
ncbi:MAG TPA: tRNA (adenosine(37)-N6)-threonylcarbamoyltransferase complex dimerization subunit type 1 TsaB [Burkholderiales bacterium]|nr:tRNA (adenosine(37)-N6)-threonylcarbamoyltransferase complex dimerization subunit type 1 TsaB [Burkholderiales bacterium]